MERPEIVDDVVKIRPSAFLPRPTDNRGDDETSLKDRIAHRKNRRRYLAFTLSEVRARMERMKALKKRTRS